MLGMANVPLTLLMLTMAPRPCPCGTPPRATMCRATAWPTRKLPLRLTAITASQSASVMSRKGAARKMPALLTSPST